MSGVVRNWQAELVEAYPDLFHPIDEPPAAQWRPAVCDGWGDLVHRACVRIRAAVQANGGTFQVAQIKEKCGDPRINWEAILSPRAKVDEAIGLAKSRSASTREICGEVGRLYAPCWLTICCAVRSQERQVVELEPHFKSAHIDEQIIDDRSVVRCRRYDRVTDGFVDVYPGSFGIEEE
ncbi:hypothetical protein [Bradyrhizobium embrapense]